MFSGKLVNADNHYLSGLSEVVTDSLGTRQEVIEGSEGDPFGYTDDISLFGKLYFRPFSTANMSITYNYSDREWAGASFYNRWLVVNNHSPGVTFVGPTGWSSDATGF